MDSVGYIIYDLVSSKVVVNEIVGSEFFSASAHSYGNLVRIKCKKIGYRTYKVYDFDLKKIYTNTYSTRQVGLLKKVDKDGFVFEEGYRGAGTFEKDYYLKDFEIKDIN